MPPPTKFDKIIYWLRGNGKPLRFSEMDDHQKIETGIKMNKIVMTWKIGFTSIGVEMNYEKYLRIIIDANKTLGWPYDDKAMDEMAIDYTKMEGSIEDIIE